MVEIGSTESYGMDSESWTRGGSIAEVHESIEAVGEDDIRYVIEAMVLGS
jgi:hypothetical protein